MSEPRRGNLYASPYEAPAREVVELTDPRRPEWGMTIELQAPDVLSDLRAEEIQAEMVRRYITGDPSLGLAPQPFMVGGKPQKTTPRFWEDVAYVAALQPDPWTLGFSRYEPEELGQLPFKHRGAWRQIGAAIARLCATGAASDPNALVEPGSD